MSLTQDSAVQTRAGKSTPMGLAAEEEEEKDKYVSSGPKISHACVSPRWVKLPWILGLAGLSCIMQDILLVVTASTDNTHLKFRPLV